jgi:serine/threonine protein kinase
MGATLFQGAAGHTPFPQGVRDGSREDRYPQLRRPPEPLPSSVDPEVAELIGVCLALEPERRPAAAEVAQALEDFVDALPQRPALRRVHIHPRI